MICQKVLIYVLSFALYVIFVTFGNYIINSLVIDCLESIWNFIFNLILSLISASIFYCWTVYIPFRRKCQKHRPILKEWLTDMDNEIRYAISRIPANIDKKYCQRNGMQVLTMESISYILSNSVWETKVSILGFNVSIKGMMEFYMNSLRMRIQSILNIYADILSNKEIENLNEILKSYVYTRLYFLKRCKCKSKEDTIFIANEIQKILDILLFCEKSLESKMPNR